MNKIERMLQELCPNGVRYLSLGECIEIYTGIQFNKRDMSEVGTYPVLNGGINPSGFTEKYNEEKDTITISQGGASAGYVNWMDCKFWAGAHCFVVKPNNDILNNRYLYFLLKNSEQILMQAKHGAGIPGLNRDKVKNLIMPIPPLPIQEEIVRVLDHFTELTAELQAELQARQEQYEYYRNRLLMFDAESVSCIKMSEIMDISRGASPRPISLYITESAEGVNWIKIGDVSPTSKYVTSTKEKITKAGAKKSKYLQKGDFILSNSMSFGRPYILKIDGCIHDGWISLSNFDKSVTSDYLYHILRTNAVQRYWKQNAGKGTVSNLNADIVRNTVIPIPPISEQKRIVSILNKFETLVNDLSQGLPAEIEAVQEQYEYYRNKLLTFNNIKLD